MLGAMLIGVGIVLLVEAFRPKPPPKWPTAPYRSKEQQERDQYTWLY